MTEPATAAASLAESGAAEWSANQIQTEARARGDLDERTVRALAVFLRRVAQGTTRPHR